jgi:hypothetical protein
MRSGKKLDSLYKPEGSNMTKSTLNIEEMAETKRRHILEDSARFNHQDG